jgi:hypothetical protein
MNTLKDEWYAIVLRGADPEIILVIDRSLTRGKIAARLLHPEIGDKNIAFRVISEEEIRELENPTATREEIHEITGYDS